MNSPYQPEAYWNEVAGQIAGRSDVRVIAGDDEPYYRYKRRRFLELLDTLDFSDRSVLEIGSGPGGNLAYLYGKGYRRLAGADISEQMIALAGQNLAGKNIPITKTNGRDLPFADAAYDLIFTSTVLQHNTDEAQLLHLMGEIARVAKNEVLLFERIESRIKGHESCLGRPVSYYAGIMKQHGFELERTKALPLQASYYTCGAIRKLFNPRTRKEGEPFTKLALLLENVTLPVTRLLDQVIPSKRDVMLLHFKRK
ncbi:class I SAM-dependent methyltransferase [Flaviaesturariibacter amylovorans]|uniref:Methyltransferase domain-containing protein n=1 Tax=Flaviaesturariibacter amylovorans TaxID=1084520 RepID=A0ABP8GQQ8_9BACT